MGRKNTFSRAISQLKSTEVDEKLELIEAIPTNNTAGLMTIGDPTVMVPGVDDQYTELDFNKDNDADDGKNTSGIFAEDGTILTREPDVGDTSYILGPMASMWYGWGNFSTFGYIRESDRKMVNLGTISGKLSDWDQETGFTSYGQLTIEQAKWFYGVEKKDKSGNDPDNANYRAFYPGPPSNVPDAFGRYLCTITGQPKVFGPPITPDTWTPPEQGSMDADSNFSLQHGRSDDLAWGGKPKGPPTKKFGGIRGRTAETDAMMSVNGMGLSPEAFEKKYGISPQEYINLPHSQSSAGGDTQIAYGGYSIEDKKNVINYYKKLQNNPSYKPKGYELDSLRRQMKAQSRGNTQIAHYEPQGQVLTEGRKKILRDIKKPYKMPKTPTKFKVKPTGRVNKVKVVGKDLINDTQVPKQFKPEPSIWRKKDLERNIKSSQEKKNEVLEYVGAAHDHWSYLTETRRKEKHDIMKSHYAGDHEYLYDYLYHGKKHKVIRKEEVENDFLCFIEDEDGKKFSMLQSELNEKIAQEKEEELFKDYFLQETEQPEREKNFDRVTKLKSIIGRTKRGDIGPEYPKEPTPELINGWHPKFGKKYKHDKLDPQSAEAMPQQGDPEIDANIDNATDKGSKARKLKTILGKLK